MQHVSFLPFQRARLLLAGWFTLLTLVGQAQFSQVQKITANPREASANFGNRVAIDGDVMVVAASQESGGGAAYVFEKSGSIWQQTARLVASDRAFADDFGRAVAISGNTIVVGAQLENEDANGGNTLSNAGSAYVFEKSGSTWSQTQKLVASDRGVDEYFGIAVGISGTTIVVGAIWEAQDASGGNTLAKAGAAYVFDKSGGTWSQTQKIVASDRGASDTFGYSVGISGTTIVVGAIFEDENAGGGSTLGDAGSVYVFDKSGSTWSQTQKLVASDRGAGDEFGYSVGISGTTIVVGAFWEDQDASGGNTLTNAGSAYVFDKSGSTWSQTQKLVASDRGALDQFGIFVSISGNTLVVGANYDAQDASGGSTLNYAGSAYVFGKSGGTWSQTQKLVASDRGQEDYFGISVGISGTTIVAGAFFEDQDASGGNTLGGAGSAYVFATCNTATATTPTLGASTICQGSSTSVSASFGGSATSGSFSDGGKGGAFSVSTSGSTVSGTYTPAASYSGTTTITFSTNDPDGSGGCVAATSTASLTVNAAATATTPTLGASTICQGSSTSVSASFGGSATSGSFSDGGKGGAFSVSTSGSTVSGTYTPAASYSGTTTITFSTNDPDGSGGCVAATSTASLTVNAAATATTPTLGASTICQGSSTSVSASFGGSATSGSFSDGGKGGAFSVSTSGSTVSGTYTPAASYSGTTTITFSTNDPDGSGGCVAATSTASLTVNAAATASTITLGTGTICQGSNVSVSATFGGSASSGSFSDGEAGGSFSVSTNGKTVSGTYTPNAGYSGSVTLTFTTNDPDGPCPAATSTTTLTVNPKTTIQSVTPSQSICSNLPFQVSVTASGQNLTYQWYRKVGASLLQPIPGATSATSTIPAAYLPGSYYVVVKGTCGKDSSQLFSLSPKAPTILQVSSLVNVVCEGSNLTLSVRGQGPGSLTYAWRKGDASGAVVGTGSSFTITNAQVGDAGTYSCTLTSECTSQTVSISVVVQYLRLTTPPQSINLCSGQTTLSVGVQSVGLTPTYQWKRNGASISGATQSSYTVLSSRPGTYSVEVRTTCVTLLSQGAVVGCGVGRLAVEAVGEPRLEVIPNPVSSREIRCRVAGMENPEFSLTTVAGRRLAVKRESGEQGGEYVLRPTERLGAGVYILQASEGKTRLSQRVFIVE